jgi:outer membrane protein assembly factor BamA
MLLGGVLLGTSAVPVMAAEEVAAEVADEVTEKVAEEADGAIIGKIVLVKKDEFDLTDERENNALYRLVNKLHIITVDGVIEKQLLLKPGDEYSARLAAESARILRGRDYLFDAKIEPIKTGDGTVDMRVTTNDVWTLKPGISASRAGGENKFGLELEELNLLGHGKKLGIAHVNDVDRVSDSFTYEDPHIGETWVTASLSIADNSDGHSRSASLIRPFYALDSRWSLGATAFDGELRDTFYSLGEQAAEYQHERQLFSFFGGRSSGLRNGWVRRYRTGMVFDDNQFSALPDGTLPALVPEDRRLNYPFVELEIIEDQFETTSNKEQLGRTEDFNFGERMTATLGYAAEKLDSDRNALLYAAAYSRGFGSLDSTALLTSIRASGRLEGGDTRNALVGFNARLYLNQSKKRMFFATIDGTYGHALDLDNTVQLGGDTGLRGYPLRYQSGDSKFLITVEQRYYTDWYPFRLFRIGGAVFADAGRVWGENPVGEANQGWLRDLGFGLRLAPTRSGFGRVIHLDLAFPLDGDASIDDVQILLEAKSSF